MFYYFILPPMLRKQNHNNFPSHNSLSLLPSLPYPLRTRHVSVCVSVCNDRKCQRTTEKPENSCFCSPRLYSILQGEKKSL